MPSGSPLWGWKDNITDKFDTGLMPLCLARQEPAYQFVPMSFTLVFLSGFQLQQNRYQLVAVGAVGPVYVWKVRYNNAISNNVPHTPSWGYSLWTNPVLFT